MKGWKKIRAGNTRNSRLVSSPVVSSPLLNPNPISRSDLCVFSPWIQLIVQAACWFRFPLFRQSRQDQLSGLADLQRQYGPRHVYLSACLTDQKARASSAIPSFRKSELTVAASEMAYCHSTYRFGLWTYLSVLFSMSGRNMNAFRTFFIFTWPVCSLTYDLYI